MIKNIITPLLEEDLETLTAGDQILLTGYIYTARDAAHKKLFDIINNNQKLPFELNNQIIYYVGPTPTKPNHSFGSAGPTTSGRMDIYVPKLLELGLKGMIGKGYRNETVKQSLQDNKAIYFGAVGGAGAVIGKTVKNEEIIAFPELGPEAIRKLYVENFPLVVINDIFGNDLYELGPNKYLDSFNN